MHNERTNSKNQVGNQADTGDRAQSVLSRRVGFGLVRSFLQASTRAERIVFGSIRHWINSGSASRADNSVADCDGRSIQRAGQSAGSGRGWQHGDRAPVQGWSPASGDGRCRAAAVHGGMAQPSCIDRGRKVSEQSTHQALGCSDRSQSLSATREQRPNHQRQRVQSRRDGATGTPVWLQAFVALLSRYCLSGSHAAGQARRCTGFKGRASSAWSQIDPHHREVSFQATIRSALSSADRAGITQIQYSRTRSMDALRGSVSKRTAILSRLMIDSDPP